MDERAAELVRAPLTAVFAPLYEAGLADCLESMARPLATVRIREVAHIESWVDWRIIPINARACPLYVGRNRPGEATVTVGRHEADLPRHHGPPCDQVYPRRERA